VADDEPNEFQKILAETGPYHLRPNSDRVDVERFIGRYLVDWGYVEFYLALTISAWTSGIRNVQRAFITQSAHSKINFLRGLLPPSWQAGAALTRHLEDGNSFRNALAHSNVAMGGFDGERQRGWHLWNVKGRDARLDIPAEVRAEKLARVAVLREAVMALMREEFLAKDADLSSLSLSQTIIDAPGEWETREEWEQFKQTAREMFPR
jgi:hypothetical protein